MSVPRISPSWVLGIMDVSFHAWLLASSFYNRDGDQDKTWQLRYLKGRQSHRGPMRCLKQGIVFSARRLKPRVAHLIGQSYTAEPDSWPLRLLCCLFSF